MGQTGCARRTVLPAETAAAAPRAPRAPSEAAAAEPTAPGAGTPLPLWSWAQAVWARLVRALIGLAKVRRRWHVTGVWLAEIKQRGR
eukprot:NODE_9924_length_324_cov_0.925651.p3 GENE.NODE_9924_length_324_cov_0.925651~~NODE_9924_length_324_cov_0.925651.p3  ORF type:complete len:87 (+),score=17.86 NODE_9924_length_324_cov_0.925651:57-317(+)